MNTPLIEMSKEEAHAKLQSYRKAIGRMTAKRISAETKQQYQAAIDGYKALAKGTPVLDLDIAMQSCGFDDKGRPRLAICRSDRRAVRVCWLNASLLEFQPIPVLYTKSMRTITASLERPQTALARTTSDGWRVWHDGYARVPMIPANVRPKTGAEQDWYILWEVEKWADNQRSIIPDLDPYLLKHLGGSLYAVLAEWDLTDLERSIMKATS
jgi:hypothetical protein